MPDIATFERIFRERHPELAALPPVGTEDGPAESDGASDGQQNGAAAAAPPAATTTAPAQPAEGLGESPPAETAAAPPGGAQPQAEEVDDVDHLTPEARAQVRAARYGERKAVKERDRLERRVEELERKIGATASAAPAPAPAGPDDDDELDPVVLEELREINPRIAARVTRAAEVEAENARLKAELEKAKPPAPPPEPEFEPWVPADAAQLKALRAVPTLNDWRTDRKAQAQANWARAVQIDGYLMTHPDWKGKTYEERYAEVVRLREEELAAAPSPSPRRPTAEDARRVLAGVKEAPLSVTDVRGRTQPTTVPSRREAWKGMTNEEILAREFPDP